MLRLITDDEIASVLNFCDGDPIGTRVGAYLAAYRTNMDFALFWQQIKDGEITAAVGKIDGDMTVYASEKADIEELSEFVRVIGFNSLFSRAETFEKMCLDYVRGDILKLSAAAETDSRVVFDVEPKALYTLICSANSAEFPEREYLPWLSDFTFRQRRNMLRSVGLFENENLVSCAVTSAETKTSAIISGVATDELFRRKGYAKACVMTLSSELVSLKKKNIFVMTDNSARTEYYKNLGFVKTGEWGRKE